MGKRPRILFLGQTLPFPPDGGVTIRTFNVLRLLSDYFDIDGLCFFRAEDQPSAERMGRNLAALRDVASLEAFPIPQEHSRTRFVWDHLCSLTRRRAYTLYAYRSRDFRLRLQELLAGQHYDLVHMDSMDLAGYLPLLRGLPVVCVHHNVESSLLRRRAKAQNNPWAKAYLRLQANLVEELERYWCPRVDLNVAVSAGDRRALEGLTTGRFAVVPNGVDTEKFRPSRVPENGLVCAGGLNWLPNHDGLDFLCEEILPLVRGEEPAVRVQWIGRADQRTRSTYRSRHGVEVTGYVDDIRSYVAQAACYVVPLRIGGGTRLKVLDAWAMGKAIVSTSIGCEGLRVVDGENILVGDSAEEFAAAVVRVLRDVELRKKLGMGGRKTAEEEYSWRVIGEEMIARYRSVLEKSPKPVATT